MVDVGGLYFFVQVYCVWMEDLGVGDGGEEGLRKLVGEERVFVGALVAADLGVDALLLQEDPVQEGAGEEGDGDAAGGVNCSAVGELDALDEMEDDGVFEAAAGVSGVCVREGGGGT